LQDWACFAAQCLRDVACFGAVAAEQAAVEVIEFFDWLAACVAVEAMADAEAGANGFDFETLDWTFDSAMQAFEVEFDVSECDFDAGDIWYFQWAHYTLFPRIKRGNAQFCRADCRQLLEDCTP